MYKRSTPGFPKLIYKIAPFQKFEKKSSPPEIFYSNFPLEGALSSQKCCVRNETLDWYFICTHFWAVF